MHQVFRDQDGVNVLVARASAEMQGMLEDGGGMVHPAPCTLHPTPYTLHPTF